MTIIVRVKKIKKSNFVEKEGFFYDLHRVSVLVAQKLVKICISTCYYE